MNPCIGLACALRHSCVDAEYAVLMTPEQWATVARRSGFASPTLDQQECAIRQLREWEHDSARREREQSYAAARAYFFGEVAA